MDQTGNAWNSYESGKSIERQGSEQGLIMLDEECSDGARITLERTGTTAPFAITCGIYGWFFHTRFFGTEDSARESYQAMKAELGRIARLVPDEVNFDRGKTAVIHAIRGFVEQFP